MVYLPGAGKIREERVVLQNDKVTCRFARAVLPAELSAQVVLEQIAAGGEYEIKIHGPAEEIEGLELWIQGNVYGGERIDAERAFQNVLEACRMGNYEMRSKIENGEIELRLHIPYDVLKPK